MELGSLPETGSSPPESEPRGGPRQLLGEREHVRRHLSHLYEISKLLAGVEGVDRTFPRLLAIATQALPLRTALLLDGMDGEDDFQLESPHLTAWRAADVSAEWLSLAAEQATSRYAYLVGVQRVEPRGGAARELEGAGFWEFPEPPAPAFVTLPLISKGQIFGMLQVESSQALAEEDLAFLDAVAHQLAVALDRYHALRREMRLRARAEALERSQRELLRRERQAHQEVAEAHRRQSLLVEASAALVSSLDYRTSLPDVARLLVPAWADCCAIDLVLQKDKGGERIAMMAVEPSERPPGVGSFVAQVLASHPWMAFPVTPENLPEGTGPVEQAEWTGFPSNLRLPIRARGRTLGVLSLISARPGRYGPADLTLFETLAQRIAAAVDSARLYQQAQEAVGWREELLAFVSHDLKTPLMVVRMNTELLLKAARPPDGERRRHGRRHLEITLRAVEQMNDLIGGVLDRAYLQGMPIPLAPEPREVDALFEQALVVLRPLAVHKCQDLVVEVCPGVPRVLADRERILQVLSNLVGNAIKFTPSGGTVTVRAKRVDGMVRISVKDTGPGIAAEDVPHLFERFWRASNSLERGTGLGLSIAQSIVKAHGGSIWVESREGAGSTFFFTLPVAED